MIIYCTLAGGSLFLINGEDALDTMKQALEKKDEELAGAQKVAKQKTEAAEAKIASVSQLEEENATLKTAIEEVKKKAAQLKEKKIVLADKVGHLTQKRDELEEYLGSLVKKMYIMLEDTFFMRVNSRELRKQCCC